MRSKNSIQWLLRMAWRDSRGQRKLLVLFISSIVFGIAALVSIRSLRTNLEDAIDRQSQALLGADLVLRARRAPSEDLLEWMRRSGAEVSREERFRTMAYFPKVDQSRFVQVRALEPGFPFYGKLETQPADLGFRGVDAGGRALVESALLGQFGLEVGDELILGEQSFTIAAALERVAGESELTGFFAPRVYIDFEEAKATGLLQFGSVVDYKYYMSFPDGWGDVEERRLDDVRATFFTDEGIRATTVEDRQASLGRALKNLFQFLNLVSLVALLLGGLGVGGAVQVYLQPKLKTVAVLRCLGLSSRRACSIYILQIMVVGLLGALVGTLLGLVVQLTLPKLLQPFLPIEIVVSPDPVSLVFGVVFGWVLATLFSLQPLLALRKVSPLQAIRSGFEPVADRIDLLRILPGAGIFCAFLGLAIWQMASVKVGSLFVVSLVVGLLILAGVGALLRATLRKLVSARWPFLWRLALSNLYCPENRTVLLVMTLGLGIFLVSSLSMTREALLAEVSFDDGGGGGANAILIDVQEDQVAGVVEAMKTVGFEVAETLPIVTMRIAEIKGRPMRDWRALPDSPVSDWVYSWEFRVTYRDHVLDNARVIAGTFVPDYNGTEPIPISLADSLTEDLGIGIGEELLWNVQGIPIRTVVSSIREVDWQLGRQNFNVVWPLGMLEAAPKTMALTTRVESREDVVRLQQAVSQEASNVSLIDLSLVYDTIRDVLDKVTFAIQFMSGFTVLTGVVVLFGTIATSRYQRLRESVLVRTMGASGNWAQAVVAIEYFFLGLLSALVGGGLAVIASWAMTMFVFEIPFAFSVVENLIRLGLAIFLTVLAGWLGARSIASKSPLEVLRRDT